MASSGWLGEKYVHGWGNYGSRFVANVYINSITRNQTNIRVKGTVKFSSYANTSYSYYYYAINAFVNNVGIGQIKPYTGANNIRNKAWSKNFDVTVNCSQSATSANLPVRFNDPTTGWVHETVTYTLYFNTYSKGPSGIKSSASYTQYSTITTSCSGINWGQGYSSSSRKLTCVASYNSGSKTENITLGTWTDGATSKSVTKNNFVFPVNTTVTITWTASTNIGSVKATSKLNVISTNPLPDLSRATVTATSTAPYCISASISGFDLKYNYTNPSVSLIIQYTLDGQRIEKVLQTKNISSSDTSATFDYSDSLNHSDPWNYVPDDETATIILRVTTSNGSSQKSVSLYCQSSYDAYVIESIPDSEKVYTEKQTTDGYLQETNNLEHGEAAEIKQLLGDATQQTYTGKNLFSGDYSQFDSIGGTGTTYAYFKLPTSSSSSGSNSSFLTESI